MSYCPLGIKNKPGKNKMWTPFFLLLVLLDLIVTVLSGASFSRYNFPPGFTFGAGTSAYQVEGAASEDGRTPSIWDTFAHAGYMHGANGDIACDEYHKYKEDVQLMVDTGLDAYKFSISWSRLIPNGRGPLNPKGLQYYNNLINELISHGIQPHVTLHNYDLPQILEDEYGGWLNRRIVEDFTAYADVCFREFGDRVSYWTTVNEPNIFAIGGYDVGIVPPKRCSPPFGTICPRGNSSSEPYIAVHNMLLAHASAARLYEREYKGKQHGFVGISIYAMGLTPLTNSTKDAIATQRAKDFFIGWIAHPLVFGDYPDIMKKNVGSRMPTFTAEESKQVKGAFDFLGVIHYVSAYVVDNPGSLELKQRDFNADMAATLIYTGASLPVELPITPWHLQEVLEYLKQDYGNPTVYILENGQPMLRNSSLEDTLRVKYVYAYIGAVLDAVRNGSNTRGYFLWSFLDLFELLSGYESSYGLYHVDLDDPDLKRYPKLSAHWYSSFLKGNNVSSDGFTELGKNLPAAVSLHHSSQNEKSLLFKLSFLKADNQKWMVFAVGLSISVVEKSEMQRKVLTNYLLQHPVLFQKLQDINTNHHCFLTSSKLVPSKHSKRDLINCIIYYCTVTGLTKLTYQLPGPYDRASSPKIYKNGQSSSNFTKLGVPVKGRPAVQVVNDMQSFKRFQQTRIDWKVVLQRKLGQDPLRQVPMAKAGRSVDRVRASGAMMI